MTGTGGPGPGDLPEHPASGAGADGLAGVDQPSPLALLVRRLRQGGNGADGSGGAGGPAALIGGGVLLAVGSLLPWVSGPDASEVVYGLDASGDGPLRVGSPFGLRGGDGWITLLGGVLAIGAGARSLRARTRAVKLTAAGAGLLAVAWSVLGLAEVGEIAGTDGRRLDLGAGIGLWVALCGSLVVVAGGLALRTRAVDELRVAGRRAERLSFGRRPWDGLVVQQEAVRRAAGRLPAEDETFLLQWAWLAREQAFHGFGAAAEQNHRAAVEVADQAPGIDEQVPYRVREVWVYVMEPYDPAGARAYLDELAAAAREQFGPSDPLVERFDERRRLLHGA